ncbi:MAG: tetratricopeptide repeat protein [Vicinamibacterales bacterium]
MAPSRIDELRRRIQNDPASIAFAQLAEEYRRSGQTEEAVRICREGLTRHPGYLSARVTLGRALLDLGELADARGEFEFVVAEAPENLAAVRGLAEISHREGQVGEALAYYQRALALSRHDPEIEEIVQQLSRQVGATATGNGGGLSFEEAHKELLSAAERVPLAQPPAPPPAADGPTAPFDFDRLVAALGSPSAPPQFEAAVTGQAGAAPIDLPEPVDLGPNPFAALEAELRAAEAPPARTSPWEPVAPPETTVPTVSEVAAEASDAPSEPATADSGVTTAGDDDTVVLADAATLIMAAVDRTPEAAPEPEPPAASEPVPPAIDASAALGLDAFGLTDQASLDVFDLSGVPGPDAAPSPVDALMAAPVADEAPRGAAALPVEPAPAPDAGPLEATGTPAPEGQGPGAGGDDVLDDLEGWLNTLQNRATD